MIIELTESLKEELNTLLDSHYNDADDYMTSAYKQDAARFYDYYHGNLPLQQAEGGSKFVDRTCLTYVRNGLKDLVEVFCSNNHGDAVKFAPTEAQDAEAAFAATKMVNQVLRENDGYNVLSMAFLEALITRTAFVKRYWGEDSISTPFNMNNVDEATANAAIQGWRDASLTVDEKEIEVVDNDDGTYNLSGFYHATFKRVKVELTPIEEILVDRGARTVQGATYFCHRRLISKHELVNLGFSEDEINEISDDDLLDSDYLNIQQARSDGRRYEYGFGEVATNSKDKANHVWSKEEYLTTSLIDPTKSPQRYQFIRAVGKIVTCELVNEIPFSAFNPLPLPHQIFGDSVVDITSDIQDKRTFLERAFVDHTNLATHGRFTAITGAYDRRSLLDNRPGGVVEMDRPDAIGVMPIHPISNGAGMFLQMIEGAAEKRTGIADNQAGNAANALETNRMSEKSVDNMITLATGRVRNMCRDLAHGGITDLFLAIYRLIKDNQQTPINVLTAYGVIPVDPEDLPPRNHVIVQPALTSEEREKQANKLIEAYQVVQSIDPQFMGVPNKAYMISQILQAKGFDNVLDIMLPLQQYQPAQPDPKYMAEVENTQADTQLKLAQAGKFGVEAQLAPEKFSVDQQIAADEKHRKDYQMTVDQQIAADKNINESNRNNVEAIKVSNAHERHQDVFKLDVAKYEDEAKDRAVNQMFKGHELQQAKHANVEVSA
ncbi:TPA: hypothetical protein M2Q89_000699 [Escherichia coli]|nr:hypothetical protein [Escherichia coli]